MEEQNHHDSIKERTNKRFTDISEIIMKRIDVRDNKNFAHILGFKSAQSLADIEKNKTRVTSETLGVMATTFKVDGNYFFNMAEEEAEEYLASYRKAVNDYNKQIENVISDNSFEINAQNFIFNGRDINADNNLTEMLEMQKAHIEDLRAQIEFMKQLIPTKK